MYDKSVTTRLGRYGFEAGRAWSRGNGDTGHWHDGYEILFLHSGFARICVDGRSEVLPPGTGIVLDAKHHHVLRPLVKPYFRTVIHFEPEEASGREWALQISRLVEPEGLYRYRLGADASLRLMWAVGQLRVLHGQKHGGETGRHILAMVCSDFRSSLSAPLPRDAALQLSAVLEYMADHVPSQESIDGVAGRFGMSGGHLRRLFGDYVGQSPKQYWLQQKLEAACGLLAAGNSVRDVAALTGFASMRGFERAFRRVTGSSPGSYRRLKNMSS